MYKFDIAQAVLEDKRYDVRSKLNNKLYAIGPAIRKQDEGLYSIVEDAFTIFHTVRAKLAEQNGSPDRKAFSNIYSAYISSEYVLDDLVQKSSGDANYFSDISEGFEGSSTVVDRRILNILSESLKHDHTDRTVRELVGDYFSWLSTQAQDAASKPDMHKFVKLAYKGQITVLGKKFKGFEYQRSDGNGSPDTKSLTWNDIGGYEDVKQQFQKYCFFLKNIDTITAKYGKISNFIPKGILLVGPPGTGKTLFANALCHEAGIDFHSFDQADVGSSYVNKTAKNLRELINKASEPVRKGHKTSSIFFIDELDSIAKKRSEGGSDEDSKVVNTLNAHMRGQKAVNGVFFIGATNREDILDPALTSSGRFSKRIEIGFPDDKALEQIYSVHMERINNSLQDGQAFSSCIDLAKIVELSSNRDILSNLHSKYHMDNDICNAGFTGAVVEDIMNRVYQEKVYATVLDGIEYKPITTTEVLNEIKSFRKDRNIEEPKAAKKPARKS